jgi:hypothetical protein
MRELAAKIKGSRHGDLWQQFNLLIGALSGDERFEASRRHLALPILGSFLWSPKSTSALNAANLKVGDFVELANADFLEALRHLAFTRQGKMLRPVDYKNLGAEELGGVYESLLALTPQISGDGNRFTFAEFAGNERKTSGSYYTPDSLVQCLLDSALDPVVEEALKGKSVAEAEKAILSLKVCDPAVGSGHFLVGAAHRLARHLARVRANAQGESEPSPLLYQHALRDVISRCLYGVDINPMSAELCRVSLWLEALEPGKPLSFLDHHIQVGNSLLGTTPALLKNGIPDDAFTPIEGDVKAKCTELKRDNKRERQEHKQGQGYLFDPPFKLGNLAAEFSKIDDTSDETSAGILEKERRYAELVKGQAYQFGRLLADTWCAAFVWKKDGSELGKLPPTERYFRKVESHAAAGLLPHVLAEVERLRDQYQFFHWHLAFPDVFHLPGKSDRPENEPTGWSGGFDVVLGNPPWDRMKHDETEWFAERAPEIANAPTTAVRKKLLERLHETNATLSVEFRTARRVFEGTNVLMRDSGRYPNGAGGELNLAILFAEISTQLVSSRGRAGLILPTTIVTDKSAQPLCQSWIQRGRLESIFDFENRAKLFPAVDSRYKFCLLTAVGSDRPGAKIDVAFYATGIDELGTLGGRLKLGLEEIRRLNPNTLSFPVIRSKKDAELLFAIHSQGTPLLLDSAEDGGEWGYGVCFLFEMNRASHLFQEQQGPGLSALLEAKLIHQFNHRAATFAGQSARNRENGNARESAAIELAAADFNAEPRHWLPESEVRQAFKRGELTYDWAIVIREVTNSTNERTIISCVIPQVGMGHTCWTVRLAKASAVEAAMFVSNLNAVVLDYAARQKVGGTHMSNFILKQLPMLPPSAYSQPCPWAGADSRETTGSSFSVWLLPRVLDLTYTAWDLEPFARDCGYAGPPFRWDEERRFLLRCELDAAFFHLYLPTDANGDWLPARQSDGCYHDESPADLDRLRKSFPTPRDAVSYIMDTFPIVRRKDEEKYNGDYRTKRVIIEIYDAMQEAIGSGQPYQTRLAPSPGPPIKPLPDWQPGQPRPTNWPSHIHPPRRVDHV